MKILILILLTGVTTFCSACYPREIVHTQRSIERDLPDSRFRRQVALSFGPGSMGLARWITGMVDDEETKNVSQYLKEVKRVQFGVYETDNLPDLAEVELPSRLQRKIARDGWELAATVREQENRAWLLYHEDGETVKDMFAVVYAENRLILAKLEGNLNELMTKVVEDHNMIRDILPESH